MWQFPSIIRTSLTAVRGKAFSTLIGRQPTIEAIPKSPVGRILAACNRFLSGSISCRSAFFLPTAPLAAATVPLSTGGAIRTSVRGMATLEQMHRTGPDRKVRQKPRPLDGRPMMKGVVLKTVIKKPRKPNSANRKCVIVRLSNGKEMTAYVPGEGHNLQEHNLVLVRCGRLQDVPGVKIKVIRGKYDCAPVVKKGPPK